MTTVTVLKDSKSSFNDSRLTTLLLKYPRMIHSELLTHRDFSRNSSSSRAIPIAQVIQSVVDTPFVPSTFYKNMKGMSSDQPLGNYDECKNEWLIGRDNAVKCARNLLDLGVHKQTVNRLLEPYSYIETVLTSSKWDNFFNLRCSNDAQPEMKELAVMIRDTLLQSTPKVLELDEWHLPFIDEEIDWSNEDQVVNAQMKSVVCCARVSYKRHLVITNPVSDEELFKRLICAVPMHASPAEHQALAVHPGSDCTNMNGNFSQGWLQFRKGIERLNLFK